jgi:hypothetical protein
MTHSIRFDFPNPQLAVLRGVFEQQVSAAKKKGQPAPTWDGFLAELLTALLSNWLGWASALKAFPTPYPTLQQLDGSQPLAETVSLSDAGEAAAQAYFAQYSASTAGQVPEPLTLDQLLSAQLQRVLLEYVAYVLTPGLTDLNVLSSPPTPAPPATPASPPPTPATCPPSPAIHVPTAVFHVPRHFLR